MINLSVFMPILCGFYYYNSVVVLEIRMVIPPGVLLLYRVVLAILCFLFFSYEIEYCSFKVYKDYVEILIGIYSRTFLDLTAI